MNVLLLATTLVAATPQQVAQDTITPTFDWPAGTVLQGQATVEQVQSQGGEEMPGPSLDISLTRTISDHPRGLLVTSAVEGQSAEATPSFIVTDNGEFVGVEGVDDLVVRMREQLLAAARSESGGELPPGAEAMAAQMVTAEAIEASAREEHQIAVGLWNGRTLRRNAVRMTQMQMQDGVTQAILPTDVEFVWRGFAPCAEGEAEQSCIELEATFFPDGDALATAFEAVLGGQNPAGELFVNRARQTRTVRILAQPDGLIPRRVEDRTVAEFDVEAGEELVDLGLTQTEITTFTVGGGLRP